MVYKVPPFVKSKRRHSSERAEYMQEEQLVFNLRKDEKGKKKKNKNT